MVGHALRCIAVLLHCRALRWIAHAAVAARQDRREVPDFSTFFPAVPSVAEWRGDKGERWRDL
jgi:hypothetical protein